MGAICLGSAGLPAGLLLGCGGRIERLELRWCCVGRLVAEWIDSESLAWRGAKADTSLPRHQAGDRFHAAARAGGKRDGLGKTPAMGAPRNESADPCPGPAISAPTSQTAPCFCTARHVPRLRFTVKYDGARAVVSVRKCTAARCMRWCCCLPSRSYATSQAAMTLLNRGSTCQHAHGLVQRCCSHMIRAL